ncbi:hypothetical protein LJC64_01430 [Ruminococcaceae bacterium OttesenSCG-928-A11]|nr:hypothetical protein [Ruminococcaceae bacterium OttesenSCG-928-A11]
MPIVIVLGLFVPIIFAAAQLLGRRFEEAAPLVMLGLLLGLYLLGCFGGLALGVWLLYLLWAAAAGWLVWRLVIRRGLKRSHLTLGLALFMVFAAALWWLCRGRSYANWDEFSHWGRALKGVYYQNVLPAVAALKDEFKEYPPGVAPLQALVMRAGRTGFREDVAIFVQGVFSVSLLLYPLRRFDWKHLPQGAGAGLLLFLAPSMLFWNYYTETTVDGLLGVLFGFVLLVQFVGEGDAYGRVLQCLACAALPLVKASGLLFAVLAWAVILVSELVLRRGRAAAGGPQGEGDTPSAVKGWLLRLAPLASALAAAGSWQLFMAVHDVPRRWSAGGFSFGALWELIAHGEPAWRAETVGSYWSNLFGDLNYGWPGGFFPYMGFFALFAGLWALLRLLVPAAKRRGFSGAFWVMWGGGLVYVLLMLFSYLFVFNEYESVRLASLSRYLNTWLCGMVVFMLGWLAVVLAETRPVKTMAPLLAAALVWVFLGNPARVLGGFVSAPTLSAQTSNIQRKYTEAAAAIRAVDARENARVYVVAMDDLGATLLRLDYELAPDQYLTDHFSSIGPSYAEDDVLSLRITAAEWARLLDDGFDYVYLYEVNDAFAADFGALFEDPATVTDGTMLQVVRGAGGVTLAPLG